MTSETNQAAELAKSLRAMRRNARGLWNGPCTLMGRSIVLDGVRICDLTDAADLLEQQHQRIGELLDQVVAIQARHIASEEKWIARQQGWIDCAQDALYGKAGA